MAPCLADKATLSAKLQSACKLPTSFQLEHPVTPINAKVSTADRLTNLEKMQNGDLYKEAKQAIMLLGIANAVKPTPQMLLDVDDSEAGTQSAKEKAIHRSPKRLHWQGRIRQDRFRGPEGREGGDDGVGAH